MKAIGIASYSDPSTLIESLAPIFDTEEALIVPRPRSTSSFIEKSLLFQTSMGLTTKEEEETIRAGDELDQQCETINAFEPICLQEKLQARRGGKAQLSADKYEKMADVRIATLRRRLDVRNINNLHSQKTKNKIGCL